MSEEKPTFKVTDRRLFNPDGTPRDIIREEEPPAPATPEPAPAATQPAEPPTAERRAGPPEEAAAPREAGREAQPEAGAQAAGDEGFLMLVEFLASFAAEALGMVNHPGGGGV